jgi:hypothetical protein
MNVYGMYIKVAVGNWKPEQKGGKLFIVIIIVIVLMPTTIQVSDTTKQLLDMLKEKRQAKSHDIVLQQLLESEAKIPKSMFGTLKGMKWKKEDRFDFNEL